MSDIKIKSIITVPTNSGGSEEITDAVVNVNLRSSDVNLTTYKSEEVKASGGIPINWKKILKLNRQSAKKKLIRLAGQVMGGIGLTIEYDFILNSEWLYLEQTIRCFLWHEKQTDLTFDGIGTEDPKRGLLMLTYVIENDIIVYKDEMGIWFYLTSLEAPHRALLEEFKAIIQDKPE